MAQIFPSKMNILSKASIVVGAVLARRGLPLLLGLARSPYVNMVGVPREQPVPFSHKHHVNGLGIDCRYCHTSVEDVAFAGIPAVKTCMTCHSQIWTEAPVSNPSVRVTVPTKPLNGFASMIYLTLSTLIIAFTYVKAWVV